MSIPDLKEGEFYLDIRKGQITDLVSNKAKLSDILEAVDQKTHIKIKFLRKDNEDESITIALLETPLGNVLQRIMNKNYAIVYFYNGIQYEVKEGTIVPSVASRTNTITETERSKSAPYIFPVRPGMKEWEEFNSVTEMYEATQVPDDILKTMETTALIETCLNYPLLINMLAANTLQIGFEGLVENFNGLRELFSREDAADKLLDAYLKTNPAEIRENESRWTDGQNAEFIFKLAFLEMMLAQDNVQAVMSSENKFKVATKALDNVDLKIKDPKNYGFLGLSTSGMLIQQVSSSDGKQKGEDEEKTLDQIISDANEFVRSK